MEFAVSHTTEEVLRATLKEMETLTESVIGFYHFLEADQKTLRLQTWSDNTLGNACHAKGRGHRYDISEAGVWVDYIRERRPVIHNDYLSLPHRKGFPTEHARIVRELVVPVFRDGNIRAIIGVGNKPDNYTEQDVESVSLLADLAYDITERKEAEEFIRFAMITDITSKRKAETNLLTEHRSLKDRLETTTAQLNTLYTQVEEYNHTLKVLLKNGRDEQKVFEETVISNVREMIFPFLEKLGNTCLSDCQKNLLNVVQSNLNNIVSPFTVRLKSEMRNFTPTEIHVANLIKEGKSNKDISEILAISENTVMFHRTNIREKLGLKYEKINLRTFLIALNQ
jgi:hypothetical protein